MTTGGRVPDPERANARREARERDAAQEAAERAATGQQRRLWGLAASGAIFCAWGLYYLFVEPSAPDGVAALDGGRSVMSFQRLVIGQAFVIVGAVFWAAAWRPKT